MNLKSVELVRNIRDENFKNCKNMTTQEKIEYTKKLANKFSSYHSSEKLFEDHHISAIQGQTNKST